MHIQINFRQLLNRKFKVRFFFMNQQQIILSEESEILGRIRNKFFP